MSKTQAISRKQVLQPFMHFRVERPLSFSQIVAHYIMPYIGFLKRFEYVEDQAPPSWTSEAATSARNSPTTVRKPGQELGQQNSFDVGPRRVFQSESIEQSLAFLLRSTHICSAVL